MPINDDPNYYKRPKPGRPKGSKTATETVGKKRARRFFELNIDERKGPTESAKIVADEFVTCVADVFKAKKRHEPALTKECWAEVAELKHNYEAQLQIMEMGPHELRGNAFFYHLFRECLKGNLK